MISKYDISTKDKIEVSYRDFILYILLQIGLQPSNKGIYYLRDLILLALQEYNFIENEVKNTDLINKLANIKHISAANIRTNIDYAFKFKDTTKAEINFKKIFNFEYDAYYMTAKTITSFIISLIYSKEKTKQI